jgi:sigma-B regulation protein RsbU (phosphoserine phosphatase)
MANIRDYTILIVDDDRASRTLLSDILEEYEVITAENGEEALELARNDDNIPELILLDIVMPGMDGYEICRRLKDSEKTRDIPIIFLTVKSDAEEEAYGLNLGAVDYITKPINGLIVKARIRTHLELRELQLKKQKELIALQRDIQDASDIQQSMLPPRFPEQPNFDIFAKMVPAKKVGGDFYDFFFMDHERLYFVIGDVSGKGFPAALFMASCLTLLKAEITRIRHAGISLASLNILLKHQCASNMYVTLFHGILNIHTGEVHYACGGHCPPYLLKSDGKVEPLPLPKDEKKGRPLGLLEDQEYEVGKIRLSKGEAIFLCTDGVTEARNQEGEMFDEKRLIKYLEINYQKPPGELSEGLIQEIEKFTSGEPQSDDITIMALRYK